MNLHTPNPIPESVLRRCWWNSNVPLNDLQYFNTNEAVCRSSLRTWNTALAMRIQPMNPSQLSIENQITFIVLNLEWLTMAHGPRCLITLKISTQTWTAVLPLWNLINTYSSGCFPTCPTSFIIITLNQPLKKTITSSELQTQVRSPLKSAMLYFEKISYSRKELN